MGLLGLKCMLKSTSVAWLYSAPNLDMEHWVFLPFLCVYNNIS